MNQDLKPGELSLGAETPLGTLRNIQFNFRLRQQRGNGFGYLLDVETEWLLGHVAVSRQASFAEINAQREAAFAETVQS